MSRFLHPNVHDKGLEWIPTVVDRMLAVTGDPGSYADIGTTAITVAEVPLSAVDFTIAAGDVSGRKITSAAKPDQSVTASGDPAHILWVDDTAQIIVLKTDETAPQILAAGLTLNWPAVTYESRDPS